MEGLGHEFLKVGGLFKVTWPFIEKVVDPKPYFEKVGGPEDNFSGSGGTKMDIPQQGNLVMRPLCLAVMERHLRSWSLG